MMIYFPLTKIENNQEFSSFIFDGNQCDDKACNFSIEPNKNINILFINIKDKIDVDFIINDNSEVTISFLQTDESKVVINGKLKQNSNLKVYFADFSKESFSLNSNIILDGEDANCEWNLASLSKNNDQKNIDVSIYHNSKKTNCLINNYGVARDNSKLVFTGICHIKNGSSNSIAHQNAKIMVFDEKSDAVAKPILKIDENSVEASHAAVVGKISDDHMFYLTSRGLSEQQARELITYGYLKPILKGFEDETIKKQIDELISEGV